MERDEYEIMYRVEDAHWWYAGLRAMLHSVWQRHGLGRGVRMLDVGCGTGANLTSLRGIARCYGIDFAREAVAFCRKRGEDETFVASATDLPFAESVFDVVISCDVLCHQSIGDKLQPLREMHRVLAPGGIVILNLPAYQWLYSSHDVHVQTNKRFTRAETSALLRETGFEPGYVTYWNSLLFPAILPTRLWRRMRPLPASDLNDASGEGMSPIFGGILAVERAIMHVAPMPFGLSVLCVGQKRA